MKTCEFLDHFDCLPLNLYNGDTENTEMIIIFSVLSECLWFTC
jgi:hypothetical protein